MSELHPDTAAPGTISNVTDAFPPWLVLRRDDLAAVIAKYAQENRRPRQWIGVVTGVGGLAVAAGLALVAERLGWPEALGPVFLAGGWTVTLGSFVLVWRRERELRARCQFPCPACDSPLLDMSRGGGGIRRAELAVATGSCPTCGAHVLAP